MAIYRPVSDPGLPDFERLATMVRDDAPALEDLWLEADGKYQTQALSWRELRRRVIDHLAEGFRGRDPAGFPHLCAAWSRARVGSTALINLFGVAGLPAYFQPVKSVLRHAMTGSRATWLPPSGGHAVSKEVAGPYRIAECLYVPLDLLVEAGFPPDRLHLLILDRHPLQSLDSWLGKWTGMVPDQRLVQHYVLATLNIGRVAAHARKLGIATTHYVYEASRDAVPAAAALFARLGLADRFRAGVVTEWRDAGQLGTDHAPIIRCDEPAVFFVPGLHGSDVAYRYRERTVTAVTDAHRALLDRHGVFDIYRANVAACIRDLDLPADLAAWLDRPLP
jgi:hypothetical protein